MIFGSGFNMNQWAAIPSGSVFGARSNPSTKLRIFTVEAE
jgi:hypothetical protein